MPDDLQLIVCDNCFIIRKEAKERKCPICEPGTLRVTKTIYDIKQIDVHPLQDLLKQIKQQGIDSLIGDLSGYGSAVAAHSVEYLVVYLLQPHTTKRDVFGQKFNNIIDSLVSTINSRRNKSLLNAAKNFKPNDIDTLINFQQALKDFREYKSGLLVQELKMRYDLKNSDCLVCCANCYKLYQYIGQNTCIFCESTAIEDFDKKVTINTSSGWNINLEELLAQILACGEDCGYKKFDTLLSAFFNTHFVEYSANRKAFDDELIRLLELFQSGMYSLSDFLAAIFQMRLNLTKDRQFPDAPYSSKISKEDPVRDGTWGELHDFSYDEYHPSYKNISQRSPIFASAFSPQEVSVPASFLVQVFLYDASHKGAIEELAKSADQDTTKRVELALLSDLQLEQKLEITLLAPGLSIDQPVQTCVWNGNLNTLQFIVDVPEEYNKQSIICTIIISLASIPIGHLKFKIKFTGRSEEANELNASQTISHLCKYKRVFISYAAEDRIEVLKRVQMLQASKVDYFQDILSLEPGERWEKSLYRNIVISDAFFLFWSRAAKKSKWVKKELIYALTVKNGHDNNPPEIIPIAIEGPPIPKPPKELNFLHFNDKLLYLMSQ